MFTRLKKIPHKKLTKPIVSLTSFDDSGNSLYLYAVEHFKYIDDYSYGFYNNWLNNNQDTFLYCEYTIGGKIRNFVFDFPKSHKKFAGEWTYGDWAKILLEIGQVASLEDSLTKVNESMKHMKYFSDIRKLAVEKKRDLSKKLKESNLSVEKKIAEINNKVNESLFFSA